MNKFQVCILVMYVIVISCAGCILPFESARMLPKGKIRLQASHSPSYLIENSGLDFISESIGLQAGYGTSEKTNVNLRCEAIAYDHGNALLGFSSISGKYSFRKDKMAGFLPLWCFWDNHRTHWGISPGMVVCFTPASEYFDFNLEFEGNIPFDNAYTPFLGLSLGAGMSPNVNKWAFRPELAFRYRPGESRVMMNFGLAFQFNVPFR